MLHSTKKPAAKRRLDSGRRHFAAPLRGYNGVVVDGVNLILSFSRRRNRRIRKRERRMRCEGNRSFSLRRPDSGVVVAV